MDPKDYDYLDIGAPSSAKRPSNWAAPVLALVAAVFAVGLGYAVYHMVLAHSVPQERTDPIERVAVDDLLKRRLTAFVEDFLPAYYNFSYGLYDQSVARVETMLTPAFQAAYNQRAEDLDFKRKLIELKVRTDGIKILPGSMAFAQEGAAYYVRLAGTMTYTTGMNGASGDFPLTLLLALHKTDSGFLVDNVERLR